MTYEDILTSIKHNPHYLNRYIKYINYYISIKQQGVLIKHHICPKAKDMFPEFSSFEEFIWNRCLLTNRQHYIAHLLLYKAYPARKSQTIAFCLMSSSKNSRLYEIARKGHSNIMSKHWSIHNKNTVNIKHGDFYKKISLEDFNPKMHDAMFKNTVLARTDKGNKRVSIEEFNKSNTLVGHTKGMTVAYDSDNNILRVSTGDPRFITGEIRGNNKGKISITNGINNKKIDPMDPIPKGWKKGMTRPNGAKGRIWINNGIKTKMIQPTQMIPEGWVKGRTFSA